MRGVSYHGENLFRAELLICNRITHWSPMLTNFFTSRLVRLQWCQRIGVLSNFFIAILRRDFARYGSFYHAQECLSSREMCHKPIVHNIVPLYPLQIWSTYWKSACESIVHCVSKCHLDLAFLPCEVQCAVLQLQQPLSDPRWPSYHNQWWAWFGRIRRPRRRGCQNHWILRAWFRR